MITQKKTSRLYNQKQLKVICDKLCDSIDDLIQVLSISHLKHNGKMISGSCPIHNGDNPSAFNLYPEGESYRGNWKCRTHGCEKIFKGSIIGFIRGVLSNKNYGWVTEGDDTASFEETIEFVEAFLKQEVHKIKISKHEIEKTNFTNIVNNIVTKAESPKQLITRQQVRKSLEYPCNYFINRGFSNDILEKYDVGLCNKSNKEMYNRAVVPIYDNDYKFLVGCTGRSIFDKCDKCGYYHDQNCPSESEGWKFPKWKHNYEFKSQNHLYNFWFAKKSILESGKVILVESPGNVWRLEQAGIHNSVAMFGSSLSDRQKIILDGSGAMTIITIMDNDLAGKKAAEIIYTKCKNTYNIVNLSINKPDVAEMTIEEIDTEIKSKI
jgi:hypothetical protein